MGLYGFLEQLIRIINLNNINMKNNNELKAVQGVMELLQKCLMGNFMKNTLEENIKLLNELEDLQFIVIDRHHEQDKDEHEFNKLGDELIDISVSLRKVIIDETLQKDFKDYSLEDLVEFLELISGINKINYKYPGGLYREKTESFFPETKPKINLTRIIMERCEKGFEENSNLPLYMKTLMFLLKNYYHDDSPIGDEIRIIIRQHGIG